VASAAGDASNLGWMAFSLPVLPSLQLGDGNVLPPSELVAVSSSWGLFGSSAVTVQPHQCQYTRVWAMLFPREKEEQLCP